jgi:hypothetical protein
MDEQVKQYHCKLAEEFHRDGPKVEKMWRSFSQSQREKILTVGACEGRILKDPHDKSLGSIRTFIPEWNLRDITSTSSNFLLDMIKHRATTSLVEQYTRGVNGGPGDHEHIIGMMAKKNLQNKHSSKHKNSYFLFTEDKYGQPIELTPDQYAMVLVSTRPDFRTQQLVPHATGEMILLRQKCLLEALSTVMHDVLCTVPTTPAQTKRRKGYADVAAALSRVSIRPPRRKAELADLFHESVHRESCLEGYLDLICNEPKALVHEVDFWFSTQPELVADEKGRKISVQTDQYISGAVLNAVHSALKAVTVWDYISRLLFLLEHSLNKQFKAIALQELSNTCHLEYTRVRAMFVRTVSTMSGGSKWFKRMPTTRSDGTVRVSLKRDPEALATENSQLYYMLQLCQDNLSCAKASEWLQKLENLQIADPRKEMEIFEGEYDALCHLSITVIFIQTLSLVVKLPTFSNKKGRLFSSGYSALENEMRQLKTGLDLSDSAVPINNLSKSNMASRALKTLDEYIVEKAGVKLGFLYQDLVYDCLTEMNEQYEQMASKPSGGKDKQMVPTVQELSRRSVEQRRHQDRTHPMRSPMHEIIHEGATAIPVATSEGASSQPRQTFKVDPSTHMVFSQLLAKPTTANGSVLISWDAFITAMTDLGFSVVPKVGSTYAFIPPEDFPVQMSIVLRRPHMSHIKGSHLLLNSRRLKHLYGWNEETFVVS